MDEFWSLVLRGGLGGVTAWIAKRILDGSSDKLEELRSKPHPGTQGQVELPGEYSDEELEELLSHFIEAAEEADEITIVRSRVELSVTYWRIRLRRLVARDRPGGI